MAEVLGLGVTHYPPLSGTNGNLTRVFQRALADPQLPAELRDPANWPAPARAEWADDEGMEAGRRHRQALVAQFARARQTLDEFNPDVVVIWGDDQYENFREDIVPPYSVFAYDDLTVRPWAHSAESNVMGDQNVWNEPKDHEIVVKGHREAAKQFTSALLEQDIDVSYAYKPLHHPGFPHAFLNTILYLDYDRRGFDYPVVAFPINCYGRRVISYQGNISALGDIRELDPPSPSPSRVMQVGAAVARAAAESPWRVALIASSSWSHSFLVESTHHLFPDTAADHRLYEALAHGDLDVWRSTTLAQAEASGQQELLNWWALLGAMGELGRTTPTWSEFVGSHLFVSDKVFAAYQP
ncbi:extradiol ring-cleavage dioxygenase [Streptomyces rubrogriseus]|uniref:DODA-type extradiol aromatic ring-opening family dioxygenase n=1 Tax=Streptomyces rubrogriseus TaxID=194673 RepID=UPI0036FC8D8A